METCELSVAWECAQFASHIIMSMFALGRAFINFTFFIFVFFRCIRVRVYITGGRLGKKANVNAIHVTGFCCARVAIKSVLHFVLLGAIIYAVRPNAVSASAGISKAATRDSEL